MKSLERVKNDGLIVRKFGNWSIKFTHDKFELIVEGDFYSHHIILYGSINSRSTWATDRPEMLPDSVKDYLTENGLQLEEYQNNLRELEK
jgi:hypothetical protein